MIFFMDRKLETNISRRLSWRIYCRIKTQSLNFSAKEVWKREEKKSFKTLINCKGGLSNFRFAFNKVVKITEAFKYATISVPLAVVFLNQPEKAGLHHQSTKKFWSRLSKRCQVGGTWTGGNPFNTSTYYF